MDVPRFMLDNKELVEVLGLGHFPNSVIVQSFHTNTRYEVEYASLTDVPKNTKQELQNAA